MRLRRTRSATRRRAAILTVVLALTAVVAIAASPASATGQPVPPFEDETWLIDITHTDEYWLNVRYNVFRPGWTYADQGYSGAHVTGHSGCGEASPPLLVNTAYAAEGEHEIIVYWGGYCTHDDDKGDETKYDDFPDGTPIAVSATLERYLPGETAPSEAFSAAGTVIVSGEAAPPVSLGSIVVDRSDPQTGAAESTTSSSTTASAQDGAAEDPEEAATGTDSDVNSDQATSASTDDSGHSEIGRPSDHGRRHSPRVRRRDPHDPGDPQTPGTSGGSNASRGSPPISSSGPVVGRAGNPCDGTGERSVRLRPRGSSTAPGDRSTPEVGGDPSTAVRRRIGAP